jgi:hypothetical protein
MTVVVQPSINAQVTNPTNGAQSFVSLPVLVDVPVVWPSGGGFTMTFPIAAGDECLVVFSSRCIDGWWSLGGTQNPPEIRMHDLSDGFCLPGPKSVPNVIGGISTDSVQIRDNAGDTFVEVRNGGLVNVTAPGGMTFTTPTLTISGVIAVQNTNSESVACSIGGTMDVTTDVIIATKSTINHFHPDVQTGSSNTGVMTN